MSRNLLAMRNTLCVLNETMKQKIRKSLLLLHKTLTDNIWGWDKVQFNDNSTMKQISTYIQHAANSYKTWGSDHAIITNFIQKQIFL